MPRPPRFPRIHGASLPKIAHMGLWDRDPRSRVYLHPYAGTRAGAGRVRAVHKGARQPWDVPIARRFELFPGGVTRRQAIAGLSAAAVAACVPAAAFADTTPTAPAPANETADRAAVLTTASR